MLEEPPSHGSFAGCCLGKTEILPRPEALEGVIEGWKTLVQPVA